MPGPRSDPPGRRSAPRGALGHGHAVHLRAEPLTAAGFAPYGDVIEAVAGRPHRTVNGGRAERHDDLARIDTARAGGRTLVSVFRTRGAALPWRLEWVERHALGSQAFMPLQALRLLVVVAPAGPAPAAEALRCFVGAVGQGVNYAPGTWHQPLVVLGGDGDVFVVDRGAEVPDCDEHRYADAAVWIAA